MKNDFKKIIFVLVYILSIILLVYLCSFTYSIFLNKLSVENYFTTNTIFSINKIVLFSSANAEVTVNTNNTTTINNLIQYTDIAIFINNNTSEYTLENTLKSVQIDDIKFNTDMIMAVLDLEEIEMSDLSHDISLKTQTKMGARILKH